MININTEQFNNLSAEEQKEVVKILNEYAEKGASVTFDNLLYEDYKEIPVDIETFITDDRYLGKAWKDTENHIKLYPFWLEQLKKLFPTNLDTAYNTLLESGARGIGKAQPLYSKLLTPNGFITMKDVTVGSLVYGEDGKPHKVTHIFPQGEKDVYEVRFSDNSTTRCCKEHLWTVIQKYNHNRETTITLEDIMNRGLRTNPTKHGWTACRFGIPITAPVEFEHRDVFISPYTLGVLIGDGHICGGNTCFTSIDSEIVDRVTSEILPNGYVLSRYEDSYSIVNADKSHKGKINNDNKYKQAIHDLKLDVKSYEKFIPEDYLLTDVNSRIQLLQGLMDTDGYVTKGGYLVYYTTSERLRDDFIFLVQSLGGTAPCRIKKGKYKNTNGEVVECRDCYEITVNLPSSISPCSLTRKLIRLNNNKKEPFRTIHEITYVGKEECQCILIDSDKHLYLTDNLIVTHNSEVACGCAMAYLMYRVMCLKNPLEFYHLKPTEKIVFAFMNIKKELSKEIAISKFQKTIQLSPWFMARGTMTQFENAPYWNPPSDISIVIGSQSDDVIGQPIFCAFFDEISFVRNQDIDKQKKKALDMIDTALGGMRTRFIHEGKNPTLLIVASSKRSEQSFMESYIKTKSETEGNSTLVVDKPVWEVKPQGTYKPITFKVGLGNKFLESVVIPDGADVWEYKSKGYTIIDVPIDFKATFIENINRALCDYAGISSFSANKYFSGEVVAENILDFIHNAMPELITVGNMDKVQYKDYFDMTKIPSEYKYKPLYIHLDMSVSGDTTGICGTWIIGKKPTTEGDAGKDLLFRLAFGFAVRAPKGQQISFEKNRNFIRWLREQGFNIGEISADTFQSYDLLQILQSEGFNTTILSVDRVDPESHICKPYQFLRSTVYEHRLQMFKCDRLFDEFVEVERNNSTGKIDHPTGGRKDLLDAVCGSVFTASSHAEEYAYNFGEDLDLAIQTNTANPMITQQQIQMNLDDILKSIRQRQDAVNKQVETTVGINSRNLANDLYLTSQGIVAI